MGFLLNARNLLSSSARAVRDLFLGKKTNEKMNAEEEKEYNSHIDGRELKAERVEELVNGIVDKITHYGVEGPALMFLYPLKATNVFIAELGILPYAPFLELFGMRGYDYVTFLSKRENVDLIIKRIEEHYNYVR